LKATTAHSVENARGEVAKRDVLAYFGELNNALAQIGPPAQLLNINETGSCFCPEKVRKRKIVYDCDCPVKPAFWEQKDPNHISVVATIMFFW
jgi:hypothetical protein